MDCDWFKENDTSNKLNAVTMHSDYSTADKQQTKLAMYE